MRVKGLTIAQIKAAAVDVKAKVDVNLKAFTERKREGSIDFRVRGAWWGAAGVLVQYDHPRTLMMCNHSLAMLGKAFFEAGATEVAVQQRDGEFKWFAAPFKAKDLDRIGSCRCVPTEEDDEIEYVVLDGNAWPKGKVRLLRDLPDQGWEKGKVLTVGSHYDGRDLYQKSKWGVGFWLRDGQYEVVWPKGEAIPPRPKVGDYFRATLRKFAGCNLAEGEYGQITRVDGHRLYYKDMRGREPGYYTKIEGIELLPDGLPEGVEFEKPPPPKYNIGDIVYYDDYPRLPFTVESIEPRDGGWDGYRYRVTYPWGGTARYNEYSLSLMTRDDFWYPQPGEYVKMRTGDARNGNNFKRGDIARLVKMDEGSMYGTIEVVAPWVNDPDWVEGDAVDPNEKTGIHYSYIEAAPADYVPPPKPVDLPLAPGVRARVRRDVGKMSKYDWFTLIERQWGEPKMWLVRYNGVLRPLPEANITRRTIPPAPPAPPRYKRDEKVRVIVNRPDDAPLEVGDIVTIRNCDVPDDNEHGYLYRVREKNGNSWYVHHNYLEPEHKPTPKPTPKIGMAMGRVYARLDTGEVVCVSDLMYMPYVNNLYDELEAAREAGTLIGVESLVIDTLNDNRWPDARMHTLWMQPEIEMITRVKPTKAMADEAANGDLIGSGCSRSAYLGADGWLYKKARDPWQNEAELQVGRALHKMDLPDWFGVPAIEPVEGDDKHYVIAADYIPGEKPHKNGCKCAALGLPKCYADLLRDITRHCAGKVAFSDTHAGNLMIHEGKLWIIDLGHCSVEDRALLAA